MERPSSNARQALAARVAAATAAAPPAAPTTPRTVSVLSRDPTTGTAVLMEFPVPQGNTQQTRAAAAAAAAAAADTAPTAGYEDYFDTPETRRVALEMPRLLKLAMQLQLSENATEAAIPVADNRADSRLSGKAVTATRQVQGKVRAGEQIFLRRAQLAAELDKMGLSPMAAAWSTAGIKVGKAVSTEQQDLQPAAGGGVKGKGGGVKAGKAGLATPKAAASKPQQKGGRRNDGEQPQVPGRPSTPLQSPEGKVVEGPASTRPQPAAPKQAAARNPILARAKQVKGQLAKQARAQAAARQRESPAGGMDAEEEWVGGGGAGLPRYAGGVVVVDGARPLALDSLPTLRPYHPRRRRDGPLANEEEGGTMAPQELLRRMQQQNAPELGEAPAAAPAAVPNGPRVPRRRRDRLLRLARALVAAHKHGVLDLGVDLGPGPDPSSSPPVTGRDQVAAPGPGPETSPAPRSGSEARGRAPAQSGPRSAVPPQRGSDDAARPSARSSRRLARRRPPPASDGSPPPPDAPAPGAARKPSTLGLVTDLSDDGDVWVHRACSSEDESWGVTSEDADSLGYPTGAERDMRPSRGREAAEGGGAGEGGGAAGGRSREAQAQDRGEATAGGKAPSGEAAGAGAGRRGGDVGETAGAPGYDSSGSWGIVSEGGGPQQHPAAAVASLESLFRGVPWDDGREHPEPYRPPQDGSIPDIRFSQIPRWLVDALPWYEPGTPVEPLPWRDPSLPGVGGRDAEEEAEALDEGGRKMQAATEVGTGDQAVKDGHGDQDWRDYLKSRRGKEHD